MRKVDDGKRKRKEKKERKENNVVFAPTNVGSSQPPERRPTGTQHALANSSTLSCTYIYGGEQNTSDPVLCCSVIRSEGEYCVRIVIQLIRDHYHPPPPYHTADITVGLLAHYLFIDHNNNNNINNNIDINNNIN